MKRVITILLLLSAMSQAKGQSLLYPHLFDLNEVTLGEGPMRKAMLLNGEVLLSYDADRLLTPFAGTKNETAWQFVSEDGKEVVVLYFKTLAEPATPIRKLQLTALDADAEYEVVDYLPAQRTSMDFGGEKSLQLKGKTFYGDQLMYNGLGVEKIDTDFAGYMWVFAKK